MLVINQLWLCELPFPIKYKTLLSYSESTLPLYQMLKFKENKYKCESDTFKT